MASNRRRPDWPSLACAVLFAAVFVWVATSRG